ncbi:MAG TPA: amidohydrolase family protein [Streptosporangiaceae bacterium]|nr:amidohydrolase family protein [Streptosporangiaceae bacterium]
MLEGNLLVDAHVHVAKLPTLSADWRAWATGHGGGVPLDQLFTSDGTPVPAAIDEHFAAEGADHVLLFSEYSPKTTGIQPIEEVLPLVEHNPARFRPVANINPHLHYPVAAELARQVALGAVACKIHPVHGGFEPADRMLYPAYSWAEERGFPVIVHCGTSTFSGSANAYGEPALLDPVFRDFPGLTVVLAHGGRGWWYDQAAFLTLMRPNVWLEVSGLPPHRLADYYGQSLRRLGAQMIFGTDWPGMPGVQRNARAVQKVLLEAGCCDQDVAAALGGNARRVFGL